MHESPNAATVEAFAATLKRNLPPAANAVAATQVCGGDVRKAEALCWKVWERIAGGTPGQRPNEGSSEAQWLLAIIRELAFPDAGDVQVAA